MEEKLTPEEIQKILEEHKRWLERGRKEGKRANLEGANLEGAIGINRNIDKAVELKQNVEEYEQKIQQLQNDLETAQKSAGNNEEQIEKLNNELKAVESSKQQTEEKLQKLEKQNKQLKTELSGRIEQATNSLRDALTNTDNKIRSNFFLG